MHASSDPDRLLPLMFHFCWLAIGGWSSCLSCYVALPACNIHMYSTLDDNLTVSLPIQRRRRSHSVSHCTGLCSGLGTGCRFRRRPGIRQGGSGCLDKSQAELQLGCYINHWRPRRVCVHGIPTQSATLNQMFRGFKHLI